MTLILRYMNGAEEKLVDVCSVDVYNFPANCRPPELYVLRRSDPGLRGRWIPQGDLLDWKVLP